MPKSPVEMFRRVFDPRSRHGWIRDVVPTLSPAVVAILAGRTSLAAFAPQVQAVIGRLRVEAETNAHETAPRRPSSSSTPSSAKHDMALGIQHLGGKSGG